MSNKQDDYVAKLRRAIVQAICEASVPEADPATGDRGDTLYIGSTEVCEALTILLAEFLEGVPGLDTPRDIRAISETVARTFARAYPRSGTSAPEQAPCRRHRSSYDQIDSERGVRHILRAQKDL